jgi:phenylacetate-CoA ligase
MAETYWERKLWEPDIETMPRKELRELQKKKLFPQLIYAYENAPFYKELYDKEKVDVYKIRTVEDFQKYVPMVCKDDLRAYRERTGDIFSGNLCLPLTRRNFPSINTLEGRIQHSTGTTGKPTYYLYTENDLLAGGNIIARGYWRDGLRSGDFALKYGGLNMRDWHGALPPEDTGLRLIGAFYYPYDSLNLASDFEIATKFEAQGIHINWIDAVIPGFRWLMQKMEQEGKNLKRDYFPELKCVDQTGEVSRSLCDYASGLFGVPVTSHGGPAATEAGVLALGCAYEWKEGDGARMYMHGPEDTSFIEILPPGSDNTVEGAEFGESVVTNLCYTAMTYIRWRNEDWFDVRYDPCPYCGCTHMQSWWKGKTSESVNVKGKTITMGDIEDVLYAYPETRPMPALLIREEPQPQDKLRLRVSYKTDLVKEPEQFRLKLEDDFKKKIGVDTAIALITPEEVRAIAHKYERVIKEKRGE